MILAGDIGGTKTNLAFFEAQGRGLMPVAEDTFASREHASLNDIVRCFASAYTLPIDSACFGVAGPVKRGRCEAVNLP
jgi:glucokinase